nr:hypothetical protein [Candidatus Njordarchaeota archaeon]
MQNAYKSPPIKTCPAGECMGLLLEEAVGGMVKASTENRSDDRSWPTYDSILVKTGLGYKYKQSIAFVIICVTGITVPLLLGNVPVSAIVSDAIWLSRPFVFIFMVYLLKNTINEFSAMFDLFEKKPVDSSQGVMGMFLSAEKCNEFRRRVRRTVFSPAEWFFGVIGAVGMTAGQHYLYSTNPQYVVGAFGTYNNSFTLVSWWIVEAWNAVFGFLLGAGVWIIFGIVASVFFIRGRGVVPEKIENRVLTRKNPTLQERRENLKDTMKFFEFHRSVRQIGDFMYRLCVKIIIAGLIWVLTLIYIDVVEMQLGRVGAGGITISIIIMLAVFALFVIPQFTIHKLIVTFKEGVSLSLNVVYESTSEAFLLSLFDPEFLKEEAKWKNRGEVGDDSQVILNLMNHLKNMGAWSFSFPTALKLLAAATVPLITAILQAIAPLLLGMGHV